ncbi:PREDICTED: uncharacterized protein LOC109581303 isoform X2 [Amphimedon queenslandica]|uniref:Uncharacterized protein n=1 Tax=Amphimedon queenslandica TaxID=400682 RepID=A0AAN0J1K9_AMPQE|nr:PREDICTED: uncharacterized protein LOC109581303 isoform X2 [Amphimedon queenslandica]|eukprot:XP_019850875.1 PREDICTED: uncharacterized protein LOC109581303 isoform X2 [Amphimedon queenslandica]
MVFTRRIKYDMLLFLAPENIMSTEIEKLKKVNSDLKEELDITKEKETAMIQEMSELKKKLKVKQERFTKFQIFLFILAAIVSMYFLTTKEQRNFIAPLPGAEVIMSTDIIIHGGQSKNFNLTEYGLIVKCPPDALPTSLYAKINIRLSLSGPYVYPNSEKWRSATPVYWISSSKDLLNPIQLGIRHYVRGTANSSVIKVFTADDSPKNHSYIFKEIYNFTVDESYVFISISHFSGYEVSTSEKPFFSGALFKEEFPTEEYQWNYNFIVFCSTFSSVIKSKLEFATNSSWSVIISSTTVIFEKNSSSIELDLSKNNRTQNWDIEARFTPLIYHKKYLNKCDDIQFNMQFSLHWKKNDTASEIRSISLPLKGVTNPKSITIPLPEIKEPSFLEKYEVIILLLWIIIVALIMLVITRNCPNRTAEAIDILMKVLKVLLIPLLSIFLCKLFPLLSDLKKNGIMDVDQ